MGQKGLGIYFQRLITRLWNSNLLIASNLFLKCQENWPNFEKCTCGSVGFDLKLGIMEPMVEVRSLYIFSFAVELGKATKYEGGHSVA